MTGSDDRTPASKNPYAASSAPSPKNETVPSLTPERLRDYRISCDWNARHAFLKSVRPIRVVTVLNVVLVFESLRANVVALSGLNSEPLGSRPGDVAWFVGVTAATTCLGLSFYI